MSSVRSMQPTAVTKRFEEALCNPRLALVERAAIVSFQRGLGLADVVTTGSAKSRFSKRAAQKLLSLWMAPDLLDGRGAGFGDAHFVAREVATLVYQHAAIDHGCPHVTGGGPPHKRLQRVANGAQMGPPKVNGDQIGTQARC